MAEVRAQPSGQGQTQMCALKSNLFYEFSLKNSLGFPGTEVTLEEIEKFGVSWVE